MYFTKQETDSLVKRERRVWRQDKLDSMKGCCLPRTSRRAFLVSTLDSLLGRTRQNKLMDQRKLDNYLNHYNNSSRR